MKSPGPRTGALTWSTKKKSESRITYNTSLTAQQIAPTKRPHLNLGPFCWGNYRRGAQITTTDFTSWPRSCASQSENGTSSTSGKRLSTERRRSRQPSGGPKSRSRRSSQQRFSFKSFISHLTIQLISSFSVHGSTLRQPRNGRSEKTHSRLKSARLPRWTASPRPAVLSLKDTKKETCNELAEGFTPAGK